MVALAGYIFVAELEGGVAELGPWEVLAVHVLGTAHRCGVTPAGTLTGSPLTDWDEDEPSALRWELELEPA